MRCTIGTSLVMAGLMIGVFAFRPPVENEASVAQAQQGNAEPEVRANRLKEIPSEPNDPRDDNTRGRLSKGTDVGFTEQPLRDVLGDLADRLGIQFYLDRRSMEAEGFDDDVQVTINLKDVPGEMALDLILREKGLAYTIRSGVVIVASKSDIQSQTEVRVYPVANGADELAQLIPATIEPHTWRYLSTYPVPTVEPYAPARKPNAVGGVGALEEGGTGSIRVFQGVLVVSQTPDVHRKIEKLINDLNSVLSRRAHTTPAGPNVPVYLDPSRVTDPAPKVIEWAPPPIPPQTAPRDGSGPVDPAGAPGEAAVPGVPTNEYLPSGGKRATTKEFPQRK